MNTKRQILLDKYIAKPLAYLTNFIVRVVGNILTINHNLDKKFNIIAVCKFKGMGSIIQTTPMLQAIRCKFPEATIIFISTESNKALLEKITIIDEIVTINDRNIINLFTTSIRSLLHLIKKRPEVYIDLEIYSDFSTLFTVSTLSKNRIGFYLRSSSFRMGIYTHMMFFNPRVSVAKVYLQIASLLGCETENFGLYPLHNNLNINNNVGEYIVVNPNASDLRLERRWDNNKFVKLIEWILNEYTNYKIILIGSKEEKIYTEAISNQVNSHRVISTAGNTSLDELISLIYNAKLMISNDTGPMHIAFCTKTPVVCLFGPCSPEQYGINEHATIIYKQVYCSPCVHDFEVPPCGGNNICMKLIQVEEVQQKVKEILSNIPPQHEKLPQTQYKTGSLTIGIVNRA